MTVKLVNGKLVDSDGETTEPLLEDAPSAFTEEINDNPDGYPVCDGCSKLNYEWQPGNRGRKPRYHKDCRPIAPNRSRVGSGGGMRNENALRAALEARYLALSRIASLRHPAYGDGIRQNIERAVDADLSYARTNPRFRKMLEDSLDKTALAEVIAVHVSMFAPIVVGESARRATRPATASGVPPRKQAPPRPNPQPQPQPQTQPSSDNVTPIRDDMYPAEAEAPAGPETINAASMPGMPG